MIELTLAIICKNWQKTQIHLLKLKKIEEFFQVSNCRTLAHRSHLHSAADDSLVHVVGKRRVSALFRVVEIEGVVNLGRIEATLDELKLLLFEGSGERHLLLHAHEARSGVRGQVLFTMLEQIFALIFIQRTAFVRQRNCRHSALAIETCSRRNCEVMKRMEN